MTRLVGNAATAPLLNWSDLRPEGGRLLVVGRAGRGRYGLTDAIIGSGAGAITGPRFESPVNPDTFYVGGFILPPAGE
jgi:hypothetical protein